MYDLGRPHDYMVEFCGQSRCGSEDNGLVTWSCRPGDQMVMWIYVWNPSMVNHTLFKFFGYKYGGSGDVTALVCYMILHLIL